MSFNGNNNNNNNNSGRFHNRYVVPVPVNGTTTFGPARAGNSRQSARDAAAEAARIEQDRWMATRLNRALLRAGTIRCVASANVASGNKFNSSSSSGANNGSKTSGTSPRYTSHIRRGTVTPLPAADKMRRYSSMNTPVRWEIIANQSADFKSALKVGGFPPLVPNYLLRTPQDLRNNAGPSSFEIGRAHV